MITTEQLKFYYLIDLHYSQTITIQTNARCFVLLPYRFTLFSNLFLRRLNGCSVLLPYRFTLFSNDSMMVFSYRLVLLPYRFTLFSNTQYCGTRPQKFYYLIDLHYSQTCRTAQILAEEFYYLIDLHYSQTLLLFIVIASPFYYLIDLHYSQTINLIDSLGNSFYYLIDLHYSQTSNLKLGIKCTHYTMHGKSIRLFYNICIMIVNKIHTNHYQSQQVFRIQKLLSVLSFQC